MIARKFVLASRIVGKAQLSNFKIVEEEIPTELQDGELLLKAEVWSVDPYMRGHSADAMKIGDQFDGAQVARVLKSRCPEFPEGCQVVGYFGWRDLTLHKSNTGIPQSWMTSILKMPDLKGLPDTYALGACGMPGITAYFGLLLVCSPKAGETLVVSAAAGAVGSLVGQIGKLKGCKVIGFAGTDAKVNWLKNDLGFDYAFNYKTEDVDSAMAKAAPEGVDIFFDNVGGEFSYDVIQHMKPHGRIGHSGSVSDYNDTVDSKPQIYFDFKSFRVKSLKMEAINCGNYASRWLEGIHQLRDWILEGTLKVQETVTVGFENIPQAFIDLMEGKNTGKQVITA